MLTVQQVRCLQKPFRDKDIATQDPQKRIFGDKINSGWANGYIVFFEPIPKGITLTDIVELNHLVDGEWEQVYPVEARGFEPNYRDGKAGKRGFVSVRFVGEEAEVWLNARYFLSITKRDPNVQWFVRQDTEESFSILARNCRDVALVKATDMRYWYYEPLFTLVSEDLP